MSLTRAEFALDLSDRTKATAAILHKKPTGLRFRPQEVSFPVTYRQQNGLACPTSEMTPVSKLSLLGYSILSWAETLKILMFRPRHY